MAAQLEDSASKSDLIDSTPQSACDYLNRDSELPEWVVDFEKLGLLKPKRKQLADVTPLLDNNLEHAKQLKSHSHVTPWNYKCLKPTTDLKEIDEKTTFRIVHFDLDKFNEFNVVSYEAFQDDSFRLNEQILDVVEDPDAVLSECPTPGEIILARKPGSEQYHRAVVVNSEMVPEDAQDEVCGILTVYFFDIGGRLNIRNQGLKPVNEVIMQFPVLSQIIVLPDIYPNLACDFNDEKEEMILSKLFHNLMMKMKELQFTITQIEPLYKSIQFGKYSANVLYNKVGCKKEYLSLAETVKALRIWKWECLILENPNISWNDDLLALQDPFKALEPEISKFELEIGVTFTAQVTRVKEVTGQAEINLVALNNFTYANYYNVVHNQMKHFANLVGKSRHYPAIKEFCMYRLDDCKEYQALGLRCVGKWCRAIRIGAEWIYFIDTDDCVTLSGTKDDQRDVRRLFGEFLQVPSLVVTICPCKNGKPMSFVEAEKIIKIGERFKFRVTSVREDSVHEADFMTRQ